MLDICSRWIPQLPKLIMPLLLAAVMGLLSSACTRAAIQPLDIQAPTQAPYTIDSVTYYPIPNAAGFSQTGIASWYGRDFHGHSTSNGERFDMFTATAAHKILPMNTMVLVTNLDNGRQMVVRINDRGPFVQGRVIDLSYGAARKLGMVRRGTARVRLVALARKSQFPAFNHGVSRLPDLRHGIYYVQIGAFRDMGNAFKLRQRFVAAGHATIIRRYTSDKKLFYRVQVYVGRELDQARTAATTLLRLGYRGAFVVAQ